MRRSDPRLGRRSAAAAGPSPPDPGLSCRPGILPCLRRAEGEAGGSGTTVHVGTERLGPTGGTGTDRGVWVWCCLQVRLGEEMVAAHIADFLFCVHISRSMGLVRLNTVAKTIRNTTRQLELKQRFNETKTDRSDGRTSAWNLLTQGSSVRRLGTPRNQ